MLCPHCAQEVVEGTEVCPACGGLLRPRRTVTDPTARAAELGRVLRRSGAVRSPLGRLMYALLVLTFAGPGILALFSVLTGRGGGGMSLVFMGILGVTGVALLVRLVRSKR